MLAGILNYENLFLIVLGFAWIIGAIFQDFKRREVDNLWNFSLIAFALAYRLIISIFNNNIYYFLFGIFGFAIFWSIGNLFYRIKLFAGGDVKLLMALGAILPLSYNFIINLKIFGIFLLFSLLAGSVWALIFSFYLIFQNRERFGKEITRQFKHYKKLFLSSLIFAVFWIVIVILTGEIKLLFIALMILLFHILFVFAKSVEESCMVKLVSPAKITEGDWLYKDIVVSGKKIKSQWCGISDKELKLIKTKYKKKVLIKYGIPFTPSFLFALIGLLFLIWKFNWIF